MLDIIYGSKIYKGARDKSKIVAALDSPVNKELVQQLSKYVKSKEDSSPEDTKPKNEESEDLDEDLDQDLEEISDELSEGDQTEDTKQDPELDGIDEAIDELSEELDDSQSKGSELTVDTINDSVPGAVRVSQKDNETWIYYGDDVNLDTIMWDVVDAVSNIVSDTLKFNRLARTENAIVFVNSTEDENDESGTEF